MQSTEELMLLNCGAGEDSWEFLGKQDQISQSLRKSTLNTLWNKWCWSWSSNTLATWCKQLTHWKIPWCWERLKAGGEEGDRGRDSWMASPIQWTWTWANSRRWWRTGKPDILQSLGLQRVGQDLATEEQQHSWFTMLCYFQVRAKWFIHTHTHSFSDSFLS